MLVTAPVTLAFRGRYPQSRKMPETSAVNPQDIAVWIFDLDNTLYPVDCDLGAQLGQRMGEFVAQYLNLPLEQARVVQKHYFHTHGTTLRGLMLEHDVEPGDYLDYVHDLDLSGIPIDDRLSQALDALPGRKVVYTNATTEHARRVVGHLGIQHHFDGYFDIVDADFVPKPNHLPYGAVLARHHIDPGHMQEGAFEPMAMIQKDQPTLEIHVTLSQPDNAGCRGADGGAGRGRHIDTGMRVFRLAV